MYRLSLFGTPRLTREGKKVKMDTRKAIALLAYLALTGETHTRDTLATLFWPESDQSRGRASLRRTLSTLRGGVGEENLQVSRDELALHPKSNLKVDVWEFEELLMAYTAHDHPEEQVCPLCISPLEQAAELYSGDFMAGFTLRDAPAFDNWQFYEADRLRRAFGGVLEKLVIGLSERGEYDRAVEYAARWLALDQLQESAHRWLMRLYAWKGQRNNALRQYQNCVRILEEELGVAPVEQTRQLYEALLEGRLRSDQEPALSSERSSSKGDGSPGYGSYPLVGRSKEWAALQDAYDRVNQAGYLFSLEGEAGIGKTRLADEFLNHMSGRGARVIAAQCYRDEQDLAFAPIVEGIRSQISPGKDMRGLSELPEYWLAGLSHLLPEIAPQVEFDVDGADGQQYVFESLTRTLDLLLSDGSGPGVLFIDDLHWVDASSLKLLAYLGRRLDRFPHFILVTLRERRQPFDHPLESLFADVRRKGRGGTLALPRLSEEDVSTLVQHLEASDVDVPEKIPHRLFEETEGLTYFIVAYLDLIQQGAREDWTLPESALDLMRSQLAGLEEVSIQTLQAAAVLGRFVNLVTLRDTSGRSEQETLSALEDLTGRGLLREKVDQDGRGSERTQLAGQGQKVIFSHQKLQEAVYDQISLARKRLLHRRAAESLSTILEKGSGPETLSAPIAAHYQRGGEEKKAAEYYQRAGDHARSVFANEDALIHYRKAIALGIPEAGGVYESVGDVQVLLGNYEDAMEGFETAEAYYSSPGRLARIARKMGALHSRRGEWALAETRYQRGLALLSDEESSGLKVRLHTGWSRAVQQRGNLGRARDLAQKALQEAERMGDPLSLARTHNILGILNRDAGNRDQAFHHLQRSLEIGQDQNDENLQVAALNNLARYHNAEGDLDQAADFVQQALALARRRGDRHHQAALLNHMADLSHAQGESEQAMAYLKEAVQIFTEIGVDAEEASAEIWKLREW